MYIYVQWYSVLKKFDQILFVLWMRDVDTLEKMSIDNKKILEIMKYKAQFQNVA